MNWTSAQLFGYRLFTFRSVAVAPPAVAEGGLFSSESTFKTPGVRGALRTEG
jgi:hypothetical protein